MPTSDDELFSMSLSPKPRSPLAAAVANRSHPAAAAAPQNLRHSPGLTLFREESKTATSLKNAIKSGANITTFDDGPGSFFAAPQPHQFVPQPITESVQQMEKTLELAEESFPLAPAGYEQDKDTPAATTSPLPIIGFNPPDSPSPRPAAAAEPTLFRSRLSQEIHRSQRHLPDYGQLLSMKEFSYYLIGKNASLRALFRRVEKESSSDIVNVRDLMTTLTKYINDLANYRELHPQNLQQRTYIDEEIITCQELIRIISSRYPYSQNTSFTSLVKT